MDFDAIRALAADGESQTVEFKRSVAELDKACRTLCGFLNTAGGLVIIGISPTGIPLGQEVSESTERKINAVLRKLEPLAHVRKTVVPIPGQREKIIVLEASPSVELQPYSFDGRPYRRLDRETTPMAQRDYESLLLERMKGSIRWESECVEATIALDEQEILRTARHGTECGRLPETAGLDVDEILKRLGLVRNERPTRAAVALFGLECVTEFPQMVLRAARFRGLTKTAFIDSVQVHGHAFALLDEGQTFLRRHLPVAGRIQPGLFEREDEPLFPIEALREALVNAICHRDYTLAGGAINVAIYDDRLEIWSDGTLPSGITIADLKRDHQSRPRNPLMAGVLFRRGLLESWGRGTQRIVELCLLAGHPEPEFLERSGAFGVRFLPSGYIAPHKVDYTLTDRQRQIMQVLSEHDRMPLRRIIDMTATSALPWEVKEDLRHLRRLHLVASDGRGRGASWRLLRLPNEQLKGMGEN